MKLKHKDAKIAESEGVIERVGLDAREILASGEYVEVTDEPEKAEPKPKPEKAKK